MTSNRFIYFILSAFVAGNLLLIFVQYNSAKNIDNLISGNEKLQQELIVDNQLRELERNLLSAELKIRGAVATNDTLYFEGVDLLIAEAKGYLDSLKKVSEHDSTVRNINRLYEVADEKLILKNRLLDSLRLTGRLSAKNFETIMQHRRLTNLVNNFSRRIYDSRKRLTDSLSISVSGSGKKARSWGTVMIVVVLLSEAILFWYIINRIRRQNQLIQQLDASEKKLREVSMIKENFMANMSHEIRTPMNAILGFTRLLKTKNRDPELTEFIDSIGMAGGNLLAIINDILDISKIEAGMIRIESAPFSLRELMQSVQTLFIEKIKEKRLTLSVSIDDNVPDSLLGDATRLTQIMVNMVGNAIKFTQKGAINISVSNRGVTDDLVRIRFNIRDTGIGIAGDKLSRIFERFGQAEDSITRKYGGTGLGLPIAKDLIVLQNGEINVESVPGKGTTFNFIIPYEIASPKPGASKLPETSRTGYSHGRDTHILVVDDNEMNLTLLRHLLNGWNFSFDMVKNGTEAIEKLRRHQYDLVLMDIQMPVMDGYTTTEEIRLNLKLNVPIIAMTAHAFAGEREKCLSFGMNEYIAKPIDEQELYRLINEMSGLESVTQATKKNIDPRQTAAYEYLDLEYMREISSGNRQYERTVTGLFIETIPVDVKALESALASRDDRKIRQTAHEMKTNVSVMGLSKILQPHLDLLEFEPFDEHRFQQSILSIKTICLNALKDARHFYNTL